MNGQTMNANSADGQTHNADGSMVEDKTKSGISFREEVIELAGVDVQTCIQCGTCSASCSTSHLMDNSIRKLVRMVLEGMKEEALNSDSVWLCTSCLLCTVRCPRGIKPKALVSALRQIYEREGRHNPDSAFEELFMKQIRHCGRVSEFTLSATYPLYNPMATLPIMTMGIELIPKGKISIKSSCVKGKDELEHLFLELADGPDAEKLDLDKPLNEGD